MGFEGFLKLDFFGVAFGVEYFGFYADCFLGDDGSFMGCTSLSFSSAM